MAHLQHHAQTRNAPHDRQLLRYTNGRPITTRRYDHLWQRIGRHLPWVATQSISTHWLRHTTLTWVERNFGYAIARAYAGDTTTTASWWFLGPTSRPRQLSGRRCPKRAATPTADAGTHRRVRRQLQQQQL
jgi:hypothetical protein